MFLRIFSSLPVITVPGPADDATINNAGNAVVGKLLAYGLWIALGSIAIGLVALAARRQKDSRISALTWALTAVIAFAAIAGFSTIVPAFAKLITDLIGSIAG